jgi:hypothetical protein
MDPSDGHELAPVAGVVRSEDMPPTNFEAKIYAATYLSGPETNQVLLMMR